MFASIFTSIKKIKDTFVNKVVDTSRSDDDDFDLDFKPLYSQELSNNTLDFSSHESGVLESNIVDLVLPSESQKNEEIFNNDKDILSQIQESNIDIDDDMLQGKEGGEAPIEKIVEVEAETEAGEPCDTKEFEEKFFSEIQNGQDVIYPSSVEDVIINGNIQPDNLEPTDERSSDTLDEIFHNIDLESQSQIIESDVDSNNMNKVEQPHDILEEYFSSIRTDLPSHSREHIVDTIIKLEAETESKSKFNNYSTIMRRKLRPNINVSDESICDICNFKFESRVQTLLPCDHGFHNTCINTWLKYSQYCPICKLELTNEIPTKEYIDNKYPHNYLIQIMTELGLIETGVDYNNKDVLIYSYIDYLNTLSEKKSIKRKSSNDSLE